MDYGTVGGLGNQRMMGERGGPPPSAAQLFLAYNKRRVEAAVQISPQKSAVAFYLVPLMLNYNHPSIPGYIEGGGDSAGVEFFEISQETRQIANSMLRDFSVFEKDLPQNGLQRRQSPVESLMLMGSVGSCAQNADSDFDYWVVVDETKLSPAILASLKRRLTAVEKWGEKQNIELHFFITDVTKVRANDFGKADKESAGSSQAKLLKEEFYRTCVHVAGKYPIWWLTPVAATDADYAVVVAKLVATPNFEKARYVDLGNIHQIENSEAFGSALWQINKAMESPYKSVLKIAFLETLISKDGSMTLPCDDLKKFVLAQIEGPDATDPYLILITRLLDFYAARKRDDVVNLIRKCFYNKASVKVIPGIRKKQSRTFKEDVMIRCVDRWGWSEYDANRLNNFKEWDFESMLKLGNELHSFLLETYKSVTDTLKTAEGAKSAISDTDLTVLGRKLFSFYKRIPGKIDPIRRPTDDSVRQESVTFYPLVQRGKKTVWMAYRGNVATEIAKNSGVEYAFLRKAMSLPEVIFWLAVNNVVDGGTFLHLIPNQLPTSLKTIQGLMKMVNDFMPTESISSIPNDVLLKQPAITRLVVVVNFTSQPWKKEVDEVTLLWQNSHGEKFCESPEPKNLVTRLAELNANAATTSFATPYDFFKVFVAPVEDAAKLEKAVRGLVISSIKRQD
ncbi:MAG: class I adenylate cyclase [Nitrospinae bacterium]|nr:class I adenylate cyclase [Nitrospinota bacterium]